MHAVPRRHEHFGRERCAWGDLPRHRHVGGYVTLVLAGRYVEAGDAGRFAAGPGDILVHTAYQAHRDTSRCSAAEVINLPMSAALAGRRFGRVDDADRIVRLAEMDLAAAAEAVAGDFVEQPGQSDWPDLLAEALASRRPLSLGGWAGAHGLHRSSVSRGFQQVFGTTPCRYRAEARTRRAVEAIAGSGLPLAELAADLGFSDQAHMSRCVTAMVGCSPARWRRAKRTAAIA